MKGPAVEHRSEPGGVSIVDETRSLKKGTNPSGVQRQHTDTARLVENYQVAAFAQTLRHAWPRSSPICKLDKY